MKKNSLNPKSNEMFLQPAFKDGKSELKKVETSTRKDKAGKKSKKIPFHQGSLIDKHQQTKEEKNAHSPFYSLTEKGSSLALPLSLSSTTQGAKVKTASGLWTVHPQDSVPFLGRSFDSSNRMGFSTTEWVVSEVTGSKGSSQMHQNQKGLSAKDVKSAPIKNLNSTNRPSEINGIKHIFDTDAIPSQKQSDGLKTQAIRKNSKQKLQLKTDFSHTPVDTSDKQSLIVSPSGSLASDGGSVKKHRKHRKKNKNKDKDRDPDNRQEENSSHDDKPKTKKKHIKLEKIKKKYRQSDNSDSDCTQHKNHKYEKYKYDSDSEDKGNYERKTVKNSKINSVDDISYSKKDKSKKDHCSDSDNDTSNKNHRKKHKLKKSLERDKITIKTEEKKKKLKINQNYSSGNHYKVFTSASADPITNVNSYPEDINENSLNLKSSESLIDDIIGKKLREIRESMTERCLIQTHNIPQEANSNSFHQISNVTVTNPPKKQNTKVLIAGDQKSSIMLTNWLRKPIT